MEKGSANQTQGSAGAATGGAAGSIAVFVLALTTGASTWLAVVHGRMNLPVAMALSLLGAATLGFIGGFVASIHRGEWPRFETSWGGLGGGLGGWKISPSLACLIGAAVFAALFAASAATAGATAAAVAP